MALQPAARTGIWSEGFFQPALGLPALIENGPMTRLRPLVSGPFTQSENIGNSQSDSKQKGPFYFWVISPFAGAQLWTYYFVLNANGGLPAIAVELSF